MKEVATYFKRDPDKTVFNHDYYYVIMDKGSTTGIYVFSNLKPTAFAERYGAELVTLHGVWEPMPSSDRKIISAPANTRKDHADPQAPNITSAYRLALNVGRSKDNMVWGLGFFGGLALLGVFLLWRQKQPPAQTDK